MENQQQSVSTASPAPPDYSQLTSMQRITKINEYRSRVIRGEKLSAEELQDSVRLMHAERVAREAGGGRKKATADSAPKKPSRIAAMLNNL